MRKRKYFIICGFATRIQNKGLAFLNWVKWNIFSRVVKLIVGILRLQYFFRDSNKAFMSTWVCELEVLKTKGKRIMKPAGQA